jgi:hypothetical protein
MMKKLITTAIILLIFTVNGFAERTITLNRVDRVMGRLFFDTEVEVGTETFHAPLVFSANVRAVSQDGFSIILSSSTALGQLRENPYTIKESWNLLPSQLKPIFKHLYQQAIEVDLSQ